jgi:hypothetical protein
LSPKIKSGAQRQERRVVNTDLAMNACTTAMIKPARQSLHQEIIEETEQWATTKQRSDTIL